MTNNSTKSRKGYKSKFDSLGLVRSRAKREYTCRVQDARAVASFLLACREDKALRASQSPFSRVSRLCHPDERRVYPSASPPLPFALCEVYSGPTAPMRHTAARRLCLQRAWSRRRFSRLASPPPRTWSRPGLGTPEKRYTREARGKVHTGKHGPECLRSRNLRPQEQHVRRRSLTRTKMCHFFCSAFDGVPDTCLLALVLVARMLHLSKRSALRRSPIAACGTASVHSILVPKKQQRYSAARGDVC